MASGSIWLNTSIGFGRGNSSESQRGIDAQKACQRYRYYGLAEKASLVYFALFEDYRELYSTKMLNISDHLRGFAGHGDLDMPDALFLTNLHWIGPFAFLNIIYKPAPYAVVAQVDGDLGLPSSLREFYLAYNGARLFLDAVRIYGCVPPGTLQDRSSPLSLPPFDIAATNEEFRHHTEEARLICFGSYGYDRSMVCMDREDQSVICFRGTQFKDRRGTWPSLDRWLTDEVDRLTYLFNPEGRRIAQEWLLLPTETRIV